MCWTAAAEGARETRRGGAGAAGEMLERSLAMSLLPPPLLFLTSLCRSLAAAAAAAR